MYLNEQLQSKWAPVLEHTDLPEIKDSYRKAVTAVILENQEKAMQEQMLQETGNVSGITAAGTDATGLAKYDPILIGLVRRALPNLMAYDVAGVQPMTGPTGLIFAMRSRYANREGAEALFNEADTDFSGTGTHAGSNPVNGTYTTGLPQATDAAEALGTSGGGAFGEMAFTIEKTSVVAKTRALKADYTVELAQDLKSVHGLDAETELSNILSNEILFEMNREIIRTIYKVAKTGAAAGTVATAGTFDLDVDANGRWSVERFKGLLFQLEREANHIAQDTRRGKGNFFIVSSDVASALQMAGVLDYAPALQSMSSGLNVDDTGNTYVGNIGKIKVYIDPYSANLGAANQFAVVGYKGQSAYDAGIFYCPYVPLQMVRAIDPNSFQPKIGFKTRYGLVSNPFVFKADGSADGDQMTASRNQYFRKVNIVNLM
jgi:hypothetical protein